jgi:hypothetical protein
MAHVIDAYLGLEGGSFNAQGSGSALASKTAAPNTSWTLLRVPAPHPSFKTLVPDLAGILGDNKLRALFAKRLKVDDKELPSGRLIALSGAGLPKGTKALSFKVPAGAGELAGRSFGWKDASADDEGPLEGVLAVVPAGSAAILGYADDPKELSARLAQALSGKPATLATRDDLAPMHAFKAISAGFFSLSHFLSGTLGHRLGGVPQLVAGLPHHGKTPIFVQWVGSPTAGSGFRATFKTTVPAGVIEDLPALVAPMAAKLAGIAPG